jgi:hypothetical protein
MITTGNIDKLKREDLEMMRQMEEDQKIKSMVWVIGDSLLMDGIAACLDEQYIPSLVRLNDLDADFELRYEANNPKLIIFELDSPCSCGLFDLLREQPGINLIGIDRNCDRVIVLNSLQRNTQSMTELFQLVNEITCGGE